MRPSRRTPSSVHLPVLRAEILQYLELSAGMCVVDATVGAGGHSCDILEQIGPDGTLIGIDRDPMMLGLAARRLQSSPAYDAQHVQLVQGSYVSLPDVLTRHDVTSVDRVLADLGLSSDQLADADRGFSFESDGPLDLRYDVSAGEPAHEILRTRTADQLAAVFRDYGEERHSDRLARQIVAARKQSPLRTARELAKVVATVIPRRGSGGSHPATRIFQALRIAANQELEHVTQFVGEVLPDVLRPGGRAAVISFHSLEDRIIKNAFRDANLWQQMTKKPVEATAAEKRHNPRSRSAKLRVAVRK